MEQQYNRGDIVVCRKSYKTTNDNFIANKKYVIVNVSSQSISVGEKNDNGWKGYTKFAIKSDKNFFCRRNRKTWK